MPRIRFPRLPTALHVISLATSAVVILYLGRSLWFFYDEWNFIANRGSFNPAAPSIWFPHNEHWSTLPILIYKSLFALFGLRTYFPYLLLVVLTHLVLAHLLWRFLISERSDPWIATGLTSLFLICGSFAQDTFLWAFQIGLIGALLFGFLYFQLATGEGSGPRHWILSWGSSLAALMFSGVAITLVVVTGLSLAFQKGWKRAIVFSSVPVLSYSIWFLIYGGKGLGSHPVTFRALYRLPQYIWTGLEKALEGFFAIPGSGAVFIFLTMAFVFWSVRSQSIRTLALASGSVFFLLTTGIVRAEFGTDQAGAGRYGYIVVALLLSLLALGLSRIVAGEAPRRIAILGVIALAALHNFGALTGAAGNLVESETYSKGVILAARDLVGSKATVIDQRPEPNWAPDLDFPELILLDKLGAFPSSARVREAHKLIAASNLQITLSPAEATNDFGSDPIRVGAPLTSSRGCAELTESSPVGLNFVEPGTALIRATHSYTLSLTIRDLSRTDTEAARDFKVEAQPDMRLVVFRARTYVDLRIKGGSVILCGLAG